MSTIPHDQIELALRDMASDETRPEYARRYLNAAASTLNALRAALVKMGENARAMQADQLESDKAAMMFIAALVKKFGVDNPESGGKLVELTDLELITASEATLCKVNPPEGGLKLWTAIEPDDERKLREGWNKMVAEAPKTELKATMELPPDHVISTDAAVARGVRMINNATPPGESK